MNISTSSPRSLLPTRLSRRCITHVLRLQSQHSQLRANSTSPISETEEISPALSRRQWRRIGNLQSRVHDVHASGKEKNAVNKTVEDASKQEDVDVVAASHLLKKYHSKNVAEGDTATSTSTTKANAEQVYINKSSYDLAKRLSTVYMNASPSRSTSPASSVPHGNDPSRATFATRKHIVLSNLHPGAHNNTNAFVDRLAVDIKANGVLRLELSDFMELKDDVVSLYSWSSTSIHTRPQETSSSLSTTPTFVPAKAFKPTHYSAQPYDMEDVDEEDELDEEAFEEEDEDDVQDSLEEALDNMDAADYFGGRRKSSNSSRALQNHLQNVFANRLNKGAKLTLNVHLPESIVPSGNTASGGRSSNSSTRTTSSPTTPTNTSPTSMHSRIPQSYYKQTMSKTDVDTVVKTLDHYLRRHPNSIVHLPDMAEACMVEPSHTYLVSKIAATVQSIPSCLLVLSSSPSILTSFNTPPLKQTLSNMSAFYDALLQGAHVYSARSSNDDPVVLTEKQLFASPFDSLPGTVRISLLPPPYKFDQVTSETCDAWILNHEEGVRDRIGEINWNAIKRLMRQRGLIIDQQVGTKCKSLLRNQIWEMNKLEWVVDVVIGSALESSLASPNQPGQSNPITVTETQFTEAINLVSESAFVNPARHWTEDTTGGSAISEQHTSHNQTSVNVGTGENTSQQMSSKQTLEKPRPKQEEELGLHDALMKDLETTGKLNSYEKKIVSCVVDPATIQLSFNDLILPHSTKSTLESMVTLPFQRPDLFTGLLARHFITGVLLFGPPGTGKSNLAKAVAANCGATFINVGLADILDKYVGEGEKNVKALFKIARRLSPCVIFMDEVDALFGRRDGFREGRREVLNEFMACWDGLMSQTTKELPRVLVMGATNRPFDLDDAILRRMPKRVLVDLPTDDARKKIVEVHLRDERLAEDVDVKEIVNKTKGWSGSDLKNLCVSAALWSAREIAESEPKVGANSNDPPSKTEETTTPESSTTEPLPPKYHRVIHWRHFTKAFTEIAKSLSEDMKSVEELRKWDRLYGEGAAKGQKNIKWGFGVHDGGEERKVA